MEKEPVVYVDKLGRPIQEGHAREGDSLDVGFGGDIDFLTEKLMAAKKVMEISDKKYPFEMKGVKRSGSLKSLDEEVKKNNNKSLKSFKEEDEPVNPNKKLLPQSITKKKPIIEEDDSNQIYFTKHGTKEDDEDVYDVKKAPSLTQELIMATKSQGQGRSIPDFSQPINENIINKSRLPDAIKQSFLKNPLTPPSSAAALGSSQLNAITDKFKKIQQSQNPVKQESTKKVISEVKDTSSMTKREKIKEQLRPIVKELIMEVLAEKLLK
jgi:hypothetical protein